MHCRRRVEAWIKIRGPSGDICPHRRQICSKVRKDVDAQPQYSTIAIKRQLCLGLVVPSVIIRKESFRTVLLPLDRTSHFPARPNQESLLWVDKGFHTKATADVRRDDSEIF